MNTNPARLNLCIDVFELKNQHALALPTLTPRELLTALLREFHTLEHLGDNPDMYQLRYAESGQPLDPVHPIAQQLAGDDHLVLAEREVAAPKGTRQPTRAMYLRDHSTGAVYKLRWLPAIIGRLDDRLTDNDRVAVDLAAHPAGLRVSRRHAQIIETDGQFYVEPLSQNPMVVRTKEGTLTPSGQERTPLHHGDSIILERSQIALKCIIRVEEVFS